MSESKWSVEFKGPRGGRYTTGSLTEEQARAKFTSLGETTYALLLKQLGNAPLTGPMNQVVEKNRIAQLAMTESALKDALKRLNAVQTSVDACRTDIKRLKKEIKASRNGSS